VFNKSLPKYDLTFLEKVIFFLNSVGKIDFLMLCINLLANFSLSVFISTLSQGCQFDYVEK